MPYRDSKLTRLLQESLGGNTASAIVVALRTESANLDETIGTLRFAQRAKAVPVVVRPNTTLGRLDAARLESELAYAREELGAARLLIDRLEKEVHARDGLGLDHESHIQQVVSALGGGSMAQRVAVLEAENVKLRNRNRTLRLTTVWQRLMLANRKARLRSVSEEQDQLARTIQFTGGVGSTGGGGGGGGGFSTALSTDGVSGGLLSRVTKRSQVLRGTGGTGGGGGGLGRRMAIAGLSEEAKRYVRFHELATARKLALASRGYEIENVFIDELYDEAKKEGVPMDRWHEFLRAEIPSPTQFDDEDEDAARDPSLAGGGVGGDAGRDRRKMDPRAAAMAATAPAGFFAASGLAGALQGQPDAASEAAGPAAARPLLKRSSSKASGLLALTLKTRMGSCVIRRISMPFQEVAPIVTAPALGAPPATLHAPVPRRSEPSRSEVVAAIARTSDEMAALRDGAVGYPRALAPAGQISSRPSADLSLAQANGGSAKRVGAGGGGAPFSHGASPSRRQEHVGSRLAEPGGLNLGVGLEDWRADLQLEALSNAELILQFGDAAAVESAKRRSGDTQSAYGLTQAASQIAAAAAVRAHPAQRASHEAAKASLRAAAASEDARRAASMAGAARAQVQTRVQGEVAMLTDAERAKVKLLP